MRLNTGINPKYLTDQHLIAEYRELFMILGQLKAKNFKIKYIPIKLSLGTGYMSFWYDKLLYVQNRHNNIIVEMDNRSFRSQYKFDLTGVPQNLINDWNPSLNDSYLLRARVIERIMQKPDWYRYYGQNISRNLKEIIDNIMYGEIWL